MVFQLLNPSVPRNRIVVKERHQVAGSSTQTGVQGRGIPRFDN
jgi:hypothetical protein